MWLSDRLLAWCRPGSRLDPQNQRSGEWQRNCTLVSPGGTWVVRRQTLDPHGSYTFEILDQKNYDTFLKNIFVKK